ncbi:MAG: winged helix-turn-helix transcriptional regulator [Bacilli bacterium]|nr:winged helix-turn-helix transcriptional regulator [Bacilli bacterium]
MKFEEKNIMMLIHDVAKGFRDRMRAKSEALGLVDAYRPIFFALAKKDGCTQLDIVNFTKLKAPTISLTLQKMEASGYITRVENESDKRITNIYITEKGKEVQEIIRNLFEETDNEFLSCLNEEEAVYTKKVLLKMIDHMGLAGSCPNEKDE